MEKMLDEQDIKRGIDFSARMGSKRAGDLEGKFFRWSGSGFGTGSIIYLFLIFFINLALVYPTFNHSVSYYFSSSALLTLAYISGLLNLLNIEQFLLFITVISLLITPIGIYFFIRKNSGYDIAAFLATLLFILPNPLLNSGIPLIRALLIGDGAHLIAFTFVPIILLLVQAFIAEGISVYGIMAAILTAGVVIISPFVGFNLVVLFCLLALAEGFLGHIRIKAARLGFLMSISIALTSFWYFPNMFNKIATLDHVNISLNKIMASLPVAIPAIPIFGTVSFLIFDRNSRLKPVLLSISILIYFYFLYSVSTKLKISGIFTADRYTPELTFGISFFFAVLLALLSEMILKNYIFKINKFFLFLFTILTISISVFLISFGVNKIQAAQNEINKFSVTSQTNKGIGSLGREKDNSIYSQIATGISIITLILFILILIRFPLIFKIENE